MKFMEEIHQFGIQPEREFKDRPGSYGVVFNDAGKILTLKVGDRFHLPGGGIDMGEDPIAALIRESLEEAGCAITDIEYLGKANQYYEMTKLGPLNKLGIFYKARLVSIDPKQSIELDHEIHWLDPDEFLDAESGEYQKWAVCAALF